MPDGADIAVRRFVLRITPENVAPLWGQLEPLILTGLCGEATHDVEDVRRAIVGMAAHLWVQVQVTKGGQRPPEVEALMVSEFAPYPKGIWLRVWLAAARPDRRLDMDLFITELDRFREAHGCVEFELFGRYGWMKRLPQLRVLGVWLRGSK